MKNVTKFSPSQKYIFSYLIMFLSHTAPISLPPPSPLAPSPGFPQIALLFKKYKRNACISFTCSPLFNLKSQVTVLMKFWEWNEPGFGWLCLVLFGIISRMLWLTFFCCMYNIIFVSIDCNMFARRWPLTGQSCPFFIAIHIVPETHMRKVNLGEHYNSESCILSNAFSGVMCLDFCVHLIIKLMCAYLWKSKHCQVCKPKMEGFLLLPLSPVSSLSDIHC